jgi:hypothetical protein
MFCPICHKRMFKLPFNWVDFTTAFGCENENHNFVTFFDKHEIMIELSKDKKSFLREWKIIDFDNGVYEEKKNSEKWNFPKASWKRGVLK